MKALYGLFVLGYRHDGLLGGEDGRLVAIHAPDECFERVHVAREERGCGCRGQDVAVDVRLEHHATRPECVIRVDCSVENLFDGLRAETREEVCRGVAPDRVRERLPERLGALSRAAGRRPKGCRVVHARAARPNRAPE
jgi:hypothetical protein